MYKNQASNFRSVLEHPIIYLPLSELRSQKIIFILQHLRYIMVLIFHHAKIIIIYAKIIIIWWSK